MLEGTVTHILCDMLGVYLLLAFLAGGVNPHIDANKLSRAKCTVTTLRSSPVDIDEASSTISTHVQAPDWARLVHAEQFEGPCANKVRSAVKEQVMIADGTVAIPDRSRLGRYRVWDRRWLFEDGHDKRAAAEKKLPLVDGVSPLASEMISSSERFVGIWRIKGRWLVQSFHRNPDRSFTKPRPIFESSVPISDVQYFPAPDTPAGSLTVLQVQKDGSRRALIFSWFHGEAFATDSE